MCENIINDLYKQKHICEYYYVKSFVENMKEQSNIETLNYLENLYISNFTNKPYQLIDLEIERNKLAGDINKLFEAVEEKINLYLIEKLYNIL